MADSILQISEFFSGTTVFITGGTGFLGKLILEKLLRSCPDIKKVYVLLREKKGKNNVQRFKELLENQVFDLVRKENGNFGKKIVPIHGDTYEPNLGMSQSDIELLIKEVECVFHCAATVKFNEKVRIATYINVRASKDMVLLAQEMKKLKSMVYLSTAYSQCVFDNIKEQFYDPPISGDGLLNMVDSMNDEFLEKIVPALIGKYPNTYTFSKSVAEHFVKTLGQGLPIAVIRPSIVISTYKEPVSGWIDNVYGPTGILTGVGVGVIRTMCTKLDCLADLVPADFVANCSICAAVEMGTQKSEEKQMKIYNYVSYNQNQISWRYLMDYTQNYGVKMLPTKTIWYPFIMITQYTFLCKLYLLFLHHIPAHIIDLVAIAIGKQPVLVKLYKKIDVFLEVLTYFSTNQWEFVNDNTQALWKNLNDNDKRDFNFNMESYQWSEYLNFYLLGARRYLIKESDDTIEQGKRKYFYLKTVHYLLVGFILLAVMQLLYVFFKLLL